jgi:hypothetical protein
MAKMKGIKFNSIMVILQSYVIGGSKTGDI